MKLILSTLTALALLTTASYANPRHHRHAFVAPHYYTIKDFVSPFLPPVVHPFIIPVPTPIRKS